MSASVTPETRSSHPGGRFLTFYLAEEEYGVEILKVREIIGMLPITRVPRTPPAVLGVINLRGKVIPVLDLKQRLGMKQEGEPERPCIIVVYAQGVELGVLVDRVSEVAYVPAEDVEDAPQFGMEVDTAFLLGIAKSEGGVKLLLDIDRVPSPREIDFTRVVEEETDA
jgi:purine-binding chemotaxis protein CheW